MSSTHLPPRPPTPLGGKVYPVPPPLFLSQSHITPPLYPSKVRASVWYVVFGLLFVSALTACLCVEVSDEISKRKENNNKSWLIFIYVFLSVLSLGVFAVFTKLCRSVSVGAVVRVASLGGLVSFLLFMALRSVLQAVTDRWRVRHPQTAEILYLTIKALVQESVKLFALVSVTRLETVSSLRQYAVLGAGLGFGFGILENLEAFKTMIFSDRRVIEGVIQAILCFQAIVTSLSACRTAYPHFCVHQGGLKKKDVVEGLVLPCVFHIAYVLANFLRSEYIWVGACVQAAVYLVTVSTLLSN